MTVHLTNIVNGKLKPDQILTNAKILSTYTDIILENIDVNTMKLIPLFQ